MIILDSTTRSLDIKILSTKITTTIPWIVSYVTNDASTFVPATNTGAQTTGGSNSTMISAPSSGQFVQVKYIHIHNDDTLPTTVVISFNDNGTRIILVQAALLPNEALVFSDTTGWYSLDATGKLKQKTQQQNSASDITFVTWPVYNGAGNRNLTNSVSASQYIGTASRAYRNARIMFQVATGAVGVTWAECAIFRAAIDQQMSSVIFLERLGYTDIASQITSTGNLVVDVALSNCNAGDQLWVMIAELTATSVAAIRNNAIAASVDTQSFGAQLTFPIQVLLDRPSKLPRDTASALSSITPLSFFAKFT